MFLLAKHGDERVEAARGNENEKNKLSDASWRAWKCLIRDNVEQTLGKKKQIFLHN